MLELVGVHGWSLGVPSSLEFIWEAWVGFWDKIPGGPLMRGKWRFALCFSLEFFLHCSNVCLRNVIRCL